MAQEQLFYFPNAQPIKAKLYKRHTYTADIPLLAKSIVNGNVVTVPETSVMAELNNYTNYQSFHWTFESEVQTQMGSKSVGVITNTRYVSIRTNSRDLIEPGDIVQLDHRILGGRKFFTVTGNVQQLWAGVPKPVKSFQILQLTSLL